MHGMRARTWMAVVDDDCGGRMPCPPIVNCSRVPSCLSPGHGFKFSSVFGELLIQTVMNVPASTSVQVFKPNRFGP